MKTSTYFLLPLIIVVFSIYQNCSNVNIEKIETQSLALALAKPSEAICAPQGYSFGAPMRISFLVDMSMSNVGILNSLYDGGHTYYSIDTSDGPTDLNGLRFNQIRSFIENCGGSNDVLYSIIGFSNNTLFTNGNSCLSSFEQQEEALLSIDNMKKLQEADLAKGSGQDVYPFYLGGNTYYRTALSCLKEKINEDLILLADEKPIYNTYFITDGLTSDPVADQNYSQILSEIQLSVKTSATAFNFYPAFYTSPGAKNQGQEQTNAMTLLNSMAKAVDPNAYAITISSLNTASSQLCDLLKPQVFVSYELKNLYAVNMTALMKDSELFADSDMDGVTDAEELDLGWNPVDPRSTSILDSLCYRDSKNKDSCQSLRATLTCNDDSAVAFLNNCDLSMAENIFGQELTGVDTDRDNLPDILEITRLTSPVRNDANDNPSADGVSNYEKIINGLDPQSNLRRSPVSSDKYTKISFYNSAQDCEENKKNYQFTLDQVPLVSTLDFPGQHAKDENLIIVFSYWQAIGGSSAPIKIYMQKITMKLNSDIATIDSPILLGEF